MKSNITMRDIAEQLDVSIVTVSKALNDKEGVSDALKEKIRQTADDMGYRYNALAKAIKEGLSYNIGVIIPERFTGSAQSFYLRFYQEITKVLEKKQYCGILHILSEEDEEQGVWPRVYYEKKVDAFIILGQVGTSYMEKFKEITTPYLFLDFYSDQSDVDSIVTDNFYGMYELTNHLINYNHTDIAFVGNIYSTSSIQDRYLGYYKSLLEHRLPLRNDYIINDRDEHGAFIDFDLPADMPSAFVCNCDQVAYNLIQTLQEKGYKVPEDCSVVGFDNDIYATLSKPGITTMDVDVEEMSRVAVKFIINKLHDPSKSYGRMFVKGNIVYRDSVMRKA